MINVQFNAETIFLEGSDSLADILSKQGYSDAHFAVAINRCFIPRCLHADTFLQDGDIIEIISPMQGG